MFTVPIRQAKVSLGVAKRHELTSQMQREINVHVVAACTYGIRTSDTMLL